jgi:predicted N-acetyltransferase YhbS
MNEIEYRINADVDVESICRLYDDAGLLRPTNDPDRIKKMYAGSDVVVSAWDGDELVGIARTIADGAWASYLADLAVKSTHQKKGIGKRLVEMSRKEVGEGSMLLLLSVPDAMDYYRGLGMEKVEHGFIFTRKG